jgi:sulfide dehydrogenase cytochrome subunit
MRSLGVARSPALFLVLFGLLLNVPPAFADPPPPGRLLAAQCAQCHGTSGVGGFEELAGRDARSLYNDLIEMKYRRETESIMDLAARGYTDAQLRLIADWLAAQPGGRDE